MLFSKFAYANDHSAALQHAMRKGLTNGEADTAAKQMARGYIAQALDVLRNEEHCEPGEVQKARDIIANAQRR